MEKTVAIVEEWLSDCSNSDDPSFLNECLEGDHERLIHAIYTLCEEKIRCPEIFESMIRQMFTLAKSKDQRLSEFVLLFAPSLIYLYLSAISMGDKKSVGNIEYTLLALYNSEVLDEEGQPRVSSFRLPTLARQSIYHDPSTLSSAFFTTDSLHRLEAGDAETVRWGPPKYMDSVTAATRYHLVTAILVAFNATLAKLPKIALMHLCKSASKLVCHGFNRHQHRTSYGSDGSYGVYPKPIPRIPVTPDLLAEMTHAIYFAIHNTPEGALPLCPALVSFCQGKCYHSPQVRLQRFNDFASMGIQALEDIHMRAEFELYAEVLLMTNAIINSLKVNPSGQPSDGPMGISVALTPAVSGSPFSKSCITNASFRTKKLPDDIPIQKETRDAKVLKSITEEGGDVEEREGKQAKSHQGSGVGKEKGKIPSSLPPLTNLVKKRDKDKKGEREKRSKDRSSGGELPSLSNRSSVTISTSDSDGTVTVLVNEPLKSSLQQPTVMLEMKPLAKASPVLDGAPVTLNNNSELSRLEDGLDALTVSVKPLEMNGSENHLSKVL